MTKKLSCKEVLMAQEIAISIAILEQWNKGSSNEDLKRRDNQYRECFSTLRGSG